MPALLPRLVQVFCLEHLQHLPPKHWNVIGGRCPHNIPLHRKVCMDGNVPERDDIAPFYLRVRLTKCLREAGSRLTNHGELLEGGGLMEFAGQERRGIHPFQKCLNHVAGIKDVLQIEVSRRIQHPCGGQNMVTNDWLQSVFGD